ncbi:hypothetical protein LTR84_002558 [Exophiala bonariae]|uniref:Carboxylesterase type B domain-containing protein n=1 Tax=Exophiala bonariae TaxID=1690606 RepID=A0AAV9NA41_9EURO|nr:hypothetical protein LTR84_002558 [Exophiala bonariae]
MGSIATEENSERAPIQVLEALKLGSVTVEESNPENEAKEAPSFKWHFPKIKTRGEPNDPAAVDAGKAILKIQNLVLNGFLSQESTVANFRGVQYATIPARWYEAVPIDPTKEVGIVDATQWGPRCPQPMDILHEATSHLYPRMATLDQQSEFECLSLNICVPHEQLRSKRGRGLPVLVWIHGGSFLFGDGGCESGEDLPFKLLDHAAAY